MVSNKSYLYCIPLLVFLLGSPCEADTLLLSNKDRMRGSVTKAKDGKLYFTTQYASKIAIDMKRVKKIATSNPVLIHLVNGWKIRGLIRTRKDGRLMIKSSKSGRIAVVKWEDVESINPAPRKWKGLISFGGSTQSGNTDRSSIAIIGDWKRKVGKRDRTNMNFLFNWTSEDGEVTTQNTFGSFKYDHFFSEKWFSYINVTLLNDKFKDLNLRTVVGPGLGYQFWSSDKRSLDLEAGISYFSEDLNDGEDDQWATGRLAAVLYLKLFNRFDFNNKLEVFPNLNDFGSYTSRNEFSLATELGAGWAFKFTNIFQYDSDPPDDVEKSDFTSIYSLQYSF